jgi:hypothetical protein
MVSYHLRPPPLQPDAVDADHEAGSASFQNDIIILLHLVDFVVNVEGIYQLPACAVRRPLESRPLCPRLGVRTEPPTDRRMPFCAQISRWKPKRFPLARDCDQCMLRPLYHMQYS